MGVKQTCKQQKEIFLNNISLYQEKSVLVFVRWRSVRIYSSLGLIYRNDTKMILCHILDVN